MKYIKEDCLKGMKLRAHQCGYGVYSFWEGYPKCVGV